MQILSISNLKWVLKINGRWQSLLFPVQNFPLAPAICHLACDLAKLRAVLFGLYKRFIKNLGSIWHHQDLFYELVWSTQLQYTGLSKRNGAKLRESFCPAAASHSRPCQAGTQQNSLFFLHKPVAFHPEPQIREPITGRARLFCVLQYRTRTLGPALLWNLTPKVPFRSLHNFTDMWGSACIP